MEKGKTVVRVCGVVPRLAELRFQTPLDWEIREGEQWAVVGPNGSGKTLLADLLQGRHALKEGTVETGFEGNRSDLVKSIAFKDIYSLADCRNSYYQQRWHATETDEMPTVEASLGALAGNPQAKEMLELFGIEDLLPKRLIFLSSGELRKFLIVRVLLTGPRILILDNPFIGLDASSRKLLVDMLERMASFRRVQVVLLLSNPRDIPAMITHVLPVYGRTCFPSMSGECFLKDGLLQQKLFSFAVMPGDFSLPQKKASAHEVTFRMEKVCIRYGSRTILKDLDWEVKNGEKWALSGPNGSGKSTLLSLIYADNPQSYANSLYLFDRKRGTGESIWEIKQRIGYVSPEMHLYYMQNVPAWQIVGSGFFDSVGLYRTCNEAQRAVAETWMHRFGIETLKDRLFLTLSSGEQRLVLLARAFVKDPDLIILDEPLHGLDVSNKKRVVRIIESFCTRPGKTLIYVTHYIDELPSCVDKRFDLVKHT